MAREMIKMLLKAAIIFIVIILVILIVFSVRMAKVLSFPRGLTLEEEKNWAVTNNVWGNLEQYNTEKYTVKGMNDYTIHCEFVSSEETENTKKYVIISHGYNSNRYGAAKYAPVYLSLGYSCIIYDLRGHGENEKAVCTIGNYESQDLIEIINDTYSRYGSDIELGLHGESMGSSTSLSALAYKPKVDFVVADCGFANLYELIGKQFKNNHVAFTEPIVDLFTRIIYGWNMKDTHAIDALSDNTVPICFIHGGDDTFITPDNSEKMNAATKGYSELHIVDNAEHAQSRAVLGEQAYKDIVESFLNEID